MVKQMTWQPLLQTNYTKRSQTVQKLLEIIKLALKYCADSAMLLEQLNSDLLSRRREFILPELNVSYRQLSYDQKAYSKWFMGIIYQRPLRTLLNKTKWSSLSQGNSNW